MPDADARPSPPLLSRVETSEVVRESRAFDFVALGIRSQTGETYERLVVRHPGAVVILPVLDTPEGPRIVYVRNERHAIGAWLDELPAGGIEPNEPPEHAAQRELREETGYAAATLVPLGRFHTTPGITDELMHAFLARNLEEVGQDLDDHEVLTVHQEPLADMFARLDAGELTDAKTILALLMARRRGLLDTP